MLSATDLKGIITPIVTPVTAAGEIDYDGLRNVVRFVLAGGVHAIFPLGSTGNFASFKDDERFEITRTVIQEVAGRVPVLVGCSDANTRIALRHVTLANKAGADALIIEPPFLFPVQDDDVVRHYRALAEASDAPVIIYNNPGDTKVRFTLTLTTQLAEIPNVIGMKDSSLDFITFQALLSHFQGDHFRILQGIEALAGASLLAGVQSEILAVSNFVPALCVELFQAGLSGNLKETLLLQTQLMSAYGLLRELGDTSLGNSYGEETGAAFFAGLEAALSVLGVCQHVVTLPYHSPTPEFYERARSVLGQLGVLNLPA